MKLRMGFVSNSSSSSFLGVGWMLDQDQIKQFIQDQFDPNFEDVDDCEKVLKYLEKFYKDLTMREDLILIPISVGYADRIEDLEKSVAYLKNELNENKNLQKFIHKFGRPRVIQDELTYY